MTVYLEAFHIFLYTVSTFLQVLPVEKKSKKPKDFVFLLYCSITFVIVLYVIVGLLGYLAHPNDVKGSITLNMSDTAYVNHLVVALQYTGAYRWGDV